MFVLPRLLICVLLIILCGAQVGCLSLNDFIQKDENELDTSFLAQEGFSIPPGGMPTQVDAAAMAGVPSIVMEVRNGSRHIESIPLPSDRPMFIEDIVQQAQLGKRLGRLNISIMRSSGPGSPPVRMEVETDADGKTTSLGQNYALRPGDHLIVTLNDKSSLERFLEDKLKM